MKVLGLSAHFHDAAAALVVDGRLIAAAAEERFSRLRHDASFPRHAARFCLETAGITAHDLDRVVFYEEPHQKFTRVMATTLGGFPRTLGPFVRAMKGWLSHKLFVRGAISKELDVHPDVVGMVPHHLSHAAAAFAASGADEAAILVVDAVGEWASTTLARGRRGHGLEVLETFDYPASLGLVYAAMTAYLGFRPNADECTTMALAAFGRPTRRDALSQILALAPDGTYHLDPRWFDLLRGEDGLFTAELRALLGEPPPRGAFAPLDAMGPQGAVPAELQPWADLAASVQAHLEDAVLGLARRLHRLAPCDTLVYAGGVALNCVANARLAAEGPFRHVQIPVDPGDGGGAVGAALLGADPHFEARVDPGHPFLGALPRGELLDDMLPHLSSNAWSGGSGTSATRTPKAVRWARLDEAALLTQVAQRLGEGQAVGWVQGAFELGPRALGGRSLLLDPSRVDRARDVSRTIKRRAGLRPYALACTAEAAPGLFVSPPAPGLERWMQTAAPLRPDAFASVRAAAHLDGTTRPQVVHAAELPRFHRLLQAFGRATGRPEALLNTSLNERGEPIVGTAVEALALFARTDLDALAVDDLLIWKEH